MYISAESLRDAFGFAALTFSNDCCSSFRNSSSAKCNEHSHLFLRSAAAFSLLRPLLLSPRSYLLSSTLVQQNQKPFAPSSPTTHGQQSHQHEQSPSYHAIQMVSLIITTCNRKHVAQKDIGWFAVQQRLDLCFRRRQCEILSNKM